MPGVDLVEHPGRVLARRRDAVQGQQDPRQLAARGRRGQRRLRQAGVGAQPDDARVVGQLGVVLHQLDPKLGPRHRQIGQLLADGRGEARRRLGARLAHRGRDADGLVERGGALLGQREDLAGALVETAQRLARRLGAGDDHRRAGAVPAADARVGLEALLDPREPAGLGVEAVQVRPQGQRRLLQRRLGGLELGVGAGQRRVDAHQRRQRPRRAPDGRDGPSVAAAAVALAGRERLGGRRGAGGEALGVAQALALGQQGRLLVDVEAGRVDRRDELLQLGALALGGLAPRPGGGERPVEAAQPPAQRPPAARRRRRCRRRRRRRAPRAGWRGSRGGGARAGPRSGSAPRASDATASRGAAWPSIRARARPSAGTRRAMTTSASSSASSRSARGRVVLVQPVPEAVRQGERRLHERVPRARAGRRRCRPARRPAARAPGRARSCRRRSRR